MIRPRAPANAAGPGSGARDRWVRITGAPLWLRGGLALGLGALAALALPPWHWLPVLVPAFCGLSLLVCTVARGRGAAFLGWCFGFGHFLAGLYWVANAFAVAGIAESLAPVAVVALAAAAAVFPAMATALWWRMRGFGWAAPLTFAASWTLFEWLRSWLILGGFPWNLIGYAWVTSDAISQSAAWFGIFGLSFITVWTATAPLAMRPKGPHPAGWLRRLAPLLLAGVVLGSLWGGGALRLAQAPADRQAGVGLRVVQANIAQHHKWQDDLRESHLARHIALSLEPETRPISHIIWPETAVPFLLDRRPAVRQRVAQVARDTGAVVITGLLRATPADQPFRLWNSLQAIAADGEILATYDKAHLVPFGEFMPLRGLAARLGLGKLTAGDTDFSAGPGRRTVTIPGLPPVSPLICYEVVFPGGVASRSPRPRWLLNITNDAWYGMSAGPYQHFAQAKLRAVEEGLPLVRAANTGISAVVDAYGREVGRLALGETGVLDVGLPEALSATTLYVRFGDWPVVLLLAAVIAWGLAIDTRHARNRGGSSV